MIDLIYCADGNRRFAEIAISHGFLYGARLPARGLYYPPYFVDQHYRKPKRRQYMAKLAEWRPAMATVLDWQEPSQFDEVIDWAYEAGQYTEILVIIPKIPGTLDRIPTEIDGKPVRLGFSYPTGYGEADFSILDEMIGWPHGIHILGGQPQSQLALYSGSLRRPRKRTTPPPDLFTSALDIRSVDGNYHNLMAVRFNEYWRDGRWHELSDHGGHVDQDAPYRAFELSCRNIMTAWGNLKNG